MKELKNSLFMFDAKGGDLDAFEDNRDNSFVGLDQNNDYNIGLNNSAE
jgi:hypothetical protein